VGGWTRSTLHDRIPPIIVSLREDIDRKMFSKANVASQIIAGLILTAILSAGGIIWQVIFHG
jgi:uncharacterized phage protein gp47/JayE